MKPGIAFEKLSTDEDMIELRVSSSDGQSTFVNQVYVGHQQFEEIIDGLEAFKRQVYGGLFNLRIGEFGPEYAGGAFDARLHFDGQGKGRVFITVKAQTDFSEFGRKEVASDATLYIVCLLGQLDIFVTELRALKVEATNEARLECGA